MSEQSMDIEEVIGEALVEPYLACDDVDHETHIQIKQDIQILAFMWIGEIKEQEEYPERVAELLKMSTTIMEALDRDTQAALACLINLLIRSPLDGLISQVIALIEDDLYGEENKN